MDHYNTSVSQQMRANQAAILDRRASPRKTLHRAITILLPDNTAVNGKTMDLSSGGMRVAVPRALSDRQECTVDFTMLMDGKPRSVSGSGRILSCVCGTNGFSIGIQFDYLDAESSATIAQFLR
jgi:hypothetical protein